MFSNSTWTGRWRASDRGNRGEPFGRFGRAMIRKGPSELTQSREERVRERERDPVPEKGRKETTEGDKRDGTGGYKRGRRDRVRMRKSGEREREIEAGRGGRKEGRKKEICAHTLSGRAAIRLHEACV